MNYVELNVKVHPLIEGREVLISELADIGFESFSDTDYGFLAYISKNQYSQKETNSVFEKHKTGFSIETRKQEIQQENWNKEWESNFSPIEVEKELLIRAPFHAAQKKFAFEIIIQPQMSFGTGHHETTWLMSKYLVKKDVNNLSVLDMGCGTAILAILAEKKGAKEILAVDIDEWSYQNALENVKLNNCHRIIVEKGGAERLTGKQFQFILANINLNVLLADMPAYCMALQSGGTILFSGLFITDVAELSSKAASLGLTFVSKQEKNNWVVVEFQKN